MKKFTRNAFFRIGVSFFLTICLTFSYVQAQYSYGYEFQFRHRRVEIPFEWQCNLIVVPIRINDSDTLKFILDTGVGMNLLTDPTVANSLGLKYVKKIDIVGAGQGEALEAKVAIGNQIHLPGISATGQSVVALSHDVLSLSDYVGMPIHGVFGYDLFRSFVVEIDFQSKLIILYHPKHYKYKIKKGQKIPITIDEGKPYMKVEAVWENGKTLPINVLLDTGAGHALSLDRNTSADISLPSKTLSSQLGRGLSGIINGEVGRLKGLRIGNSELKDVMTSFPDTNSIASRIIKNTQRQGNIGGDILKRFKVTFNYGEGYAIFKPNKAAFKEPFERDMTGIVLRAKGSYFEKYYIEKVEQDSPAEAAGLQAGDEIISVNERMAHSMKLNDIYKMFQRGNSKTIKLFINRNGQFLYAEFLMRRMI
jgi:predicted aspartyl protease